MAGIRIYGRIILLGGNKQQLAVYNGRETSVADACSNNSHRVHYYPMEYLTYGNGSSALMTTRPNQFREYKVVDHLGSTRVVLDSNGAVLNTTDYEPFGKPLAGLPPREGFIGKEQDKESELADHGVRKFNYDDGIFTSIDPLWEKYRGWSPYQYAANNPLKLIDPSGLVVTFQDGDSGTEHETIYGQRDSEGNFVNTDYRARFDKLNRSDINYIVRNTSIPNAAGITGNLVGTLNTDGHSVFVDIDRSRGANYATDGTHEMVHAEQFEDSKIWFQTDATNSWVTVGNTINYEVEAYSKQVVKNPDYNYTTPFELYANVAQNYTGLIGNTNRTQYAPISRRQVIQNDTYFGIYIPELKKGRR